MNIKYIKEKMTKSNSKIFLLPVLLSLLTLLGCNDNNPVDNSDPIHSWVNVSNNLPKGQLYYTTNFGDKLYVYTNDKLYTSINNGESWEKIGSSIPDSIYIQSIAVNDNIIVVGTYGNGVLISNDLGATWFEPANAGLDTESKSVHSIKISSDVIYIGAGTDAKVFKSTNYGESWESFSNGFPMSTPQYYPRVSLLLEKDDQFFAASFMNGIYTTNKNSDNWQPINEGLPFLPTVWNITVTDSFYFATVHALPLIETGLYRRAFNDSSWVKLPVKIEDSAPHFVVAKDRTILVSTDTQIEISFDNGMTWNKCYNGLESIEYPNFYDAFIHNDYVFTFDNNRSIWRYSLK